MPVPGRVGWRIRCTLLLALAGTGTTVLAEDPAPLEVSARGARTVAFSADGQLAAVSSLAHGGSLWDLGGQERRFDWNHRAGAPSAIAAFAFSPDGAFAISAEHDTLVLWSTARGDALTFFRAPAAVLSLALGPEGKTALLGLADGNAVLFDPREGGIKRTFPHEGRVLSVAMDRRGALALCGSADRSLRLWDVASGRQLQRWEHAGAVKLVALSPDGARAFGAARGEGATLRDTATGLSLGQLPGPGLARLKRPTPTAAAFSPDGSRLLIGGADGSLGLWQVQGLEEKTRWALPRRSTVRPAGNGVLAVGYAGEDVLGASSDGFIHRRPVSR